MKLSIEEKENLEDLLAHEGYKVFWKVLEDSVRLMEADVVQYNLSTGTPTELTHIKCRAEGASRLLHAVQNRMSSFNAQARKKRLKDRVAT